MLESEQPARATPRVPLGGDYWEADPGLVKSLWKVCASMTPARYAQHRDDPGQRRSY